MLHQGTIFFKVVHFSGISVLFLYVFSAHYTRTMTRFSKILIVVTLISVFAEQLSFSQGYRPGSERENLIISAVSELNDNKIDDARKTLSSMLAEDSADDAAWYYLALTSLSQGIVDEAEEYLKRAIEIDPGNFWYRYRLAGIYGATQRPELTIDMYEKLLEDFPKKSELYFDMVDLYAAQGEYDKALDTINEIETVFGVTESLAMYRFNLLRYLEKHEEAYASLEEYNKDYSSPYVLVTLADWQMSMYNDSTALAYYDEALDLVPDYAPALLGKAETYRLTRNYDEYFDVMDKFVTSKDIPALSKSDYLMAVVQRTDPKFIRSFLPRLDNLMDKAVEAHPHDSTLLQTAGVYYYSTERKPQAKVHFKANAEAYPESLSAAATYVEYLMYAEDWQDLSEEGRAAYERFPQETAFLEMASVADYNMMEYDKVLEICHKVLEVAPSDSSKTLRAWSTMGDIYHQLGDSKKSYKAYEKALKINPDYVYVLNNYAYYLSQEGKKLKKAYAMSKKTIEAEPDNSTYLDTFGWILYLQGKAIEAKPFFKQAMLYGGKDSAVVLDHYAEVLYALKEYDMAFVYWNMARQKNDGDIPGLDAKIEERKKAINR